MSGGDLGVVIVTGFLAVATTLMAWYTRRAAQDSEKAIEVGILSAQAAVDQAEATREIIEESRVDRQLAVQPIIHVGPIGHTTQHLESFGETASLMNAGSGPAIGVRVFTWRDQTTNVWMRSREFNLAAHSGTGSVNRDMFTAMSGLPEQTWFMNDPDDTRLSTVVVFWRDALGWRYRLPVIAFPTQTPGIFDFRLVDPERCEPDPLRNTWAEDIRIFPTRS